MTAWTDPRDGSGSWEPERRRDNSLRACAVDFIICLLGLIAFVAFIVVGRAAMCEYGSDPLPGYCSQAVR